MKMSKINKLINFFLLFMCTTTTSFAQEIVGVGEFKIGMTIDEFLELPVIKGKSLQDKSNRNNFPGENDLWKISVDNTEINETARIYSADIVVFEFSAPMGVLNSAGKDIYDTSAKFYKGKLAFINVAVDAVSSSNFEEILTAKYGKPEGVPDFV